MANAITTITTTGQAEAAYFPGSAATFLPAQASPVLPVNSYLTAEALRLNNERMQHEQAAAYYLGKAKPYKQSLAHCKIAGAILAPLAVSCIPSTLLHDGTSSALFCYAMVALAGFFVPFGLAPIAHFKRNHSYFIIVNWIILAFAFALLAGIACIIGPFYYIHAKGKIRRNKRRARAELIMAENCRIQLEGLYRQG